MWGSCFWFCIPPPSPPPPPAAALTHHLLLPSSHIQLVTTQLTHNSTHTQLAHTLAHIQLSSHNLLPYHTYNLSSYNLLTSLTHHLLLPSSHIQLVITQLTHNSTHTHNLLTYNSTHATCSHITHTTCHHTTCSHPSHTTYSSRHHTYNLSSYNLITSLTHHLLLPSSHIQLVITQLTHNSTHTHTTCSHTTQLTQLAHTQLNSHTTCSHITHTTCHHTICSHTTQLTHNLPTHTTCHQTTCSHTTWRHPPSFHVAGVALGHIHIRFTWQAWHLRHWAGSGGAPGSRLTPWTPRLFAWQAWHLVTSTFTLRGRRGTWSHPHSFHVAGVAITALGGLWWRTGFSADAVDAVALCVAGVALGGIWHLVTSTFVSRGRRGTYGTGRALVAHRVLG